MTVLARLIFDLDQCLIGLEMPSCVVWIARRFKRAKQPDRNGRSG
jgi:hypothetical protein